MPRKKKEEVQENKEEVVEKKPRGRKKSTKAEEVVEAKVEVKETKKKEEVKEEKTEVKNKEVDNKVKRLNIMGYTVLAIGFILLMVLVSATSKYRLNGDSVTYLIDIDYSQFTDLVAKEDKSVVLVGRPTCSHCVAFKPIITKVANDYEVEIYYLNTDEITNETDFNNLWDFIEASGTPTTVIVGNDKLISSKEGELPREELVNWLGENGVI